MNKSVAVHGNIRFAGKGMQVENVDIEDLPQDPASPDPGRVWINTAQSKLKACIGLDASSQPIVKSLAMDGDFQPLSQVLTDFSALTGTGKLERNAAGQLTYRASNILEVYAGSIPQVSGTRTFTLGNTVPAATVGTQVFTRAITPKSANSNFVFSFAGMVDVSNNTARNILFLLYRKIGTGAYTFVGYGCSYQSGAGKPESLAFSIDDAPATTQEVTYMGRVAATVAGTWYLGRNANATLGVTNRSVYTIEELEAL